MCGLHDEKAVLEPYNRSKSKRITRGQGYPDAYDAYKRIDKFRRWALKEPKCRECEIDVVEGCLYFDSIVYSMDLHFAGADHNYPNPPLPLGITREILIEKMKESTVTYDELVSERFCFKPEKEEDTCKFTPH